MIFRIGHVWQLFVMGLLRNTVRSNELQATTSPHKYSYREVGDNVSFAVRTNPEAVLNVSSTADAS